VLRCTGIDITKTVALDFWIVSDVSFKTRGRGSRFAECARRAKHSRVIRKKRKKDR
jgi:hypothetical protein